MVYNKYIEFEFDSSKSLSNKEKHGIDFIEAQALWQSSHFEFSLITDGEARWAVIGKILDIYWTAVITRRTLKIRIISVRRSRNEEKEVYKVRFEDDHQ